ncbi:hypothetical protein CYLTODRAFT_366707 [Cylindrobasidium torrendii FP15055 ss-10]|uniref:Topoisomerase I damage affected protein 2 n=1 Tax=Cylindrobasidium torrendii FP15055 ss-10 TaxID=1314674 RepID=A0A0D7BTJ8_9AGAR|nr:hypothetical protein CYLTODRAFT_366707 [Cylindrobasidium torrendii FP15055 ss-10]
MSSPRPPQSPNPGNASTSPNPDAFPADQVKPYIKALLSSTLSPSTTTNSTSSSVSSSVKATPPTPQQMSEIRNRVKERMLEIKASGFKYIVLTHIAENRGQGARADISCHWEEADQVVQEIYSNDAITCVCVAFAIRVA